MIWSGDVGLALIADFPDLEPEDIRACIAYAARYLDHTVLVSA